MADNADNKAAKADDDLEQQIAELKRELGNLRAAIAERAQDVIGGVEGLYDSAAEQASRATQALRAQAGVVRDNPGTISTAFVVGGIVGLLFGLALGRSEPEPRRWYERR
jgi:ElaB/YqjD/DUF883 family membrane-anchored ribosome-binding protein